MKKIFLLFFCLFFVLLTYSQKYCTSNNWDWWGDNTQDNWTFISADKGKVDWMGSIWTGPSRNVLSINRILVSEDYTPKNGWILLYKDFGCSGGLNNPYFILYNKYRGKLRLFMLLYNLNFGNGGIATMRWANTSKTTSLLTHGTGLSRVNEAYHSGTPIGGDVFTSTTDKISNSFYSDKWFVADFDVAFDHKTPAYANDYQLAIDVSAIQKSSVQMSGSLDWITEPYSPNLDNSKITSSKDENGKDIKSYLTDARKITKSIPSESDLKKVFGDRNKELINYQTNTEVSFGNTKISEKYQLTMTELEQGSTFVNFLTGVAKYSPLIGQGIDVGIGVFDFLSSKPNAGPQQVIVMPTVTHGTVNLTGTITTDMPIEPIVMGLPGTTQNISAYAPFYNCPLGVIGLEKEPQLSIRKWSESRLFYSQLKKNDDKSYFVMASGYTTDQYKSIRIDEDLKIAINALANAEVIDIKAALCGRIRKKTNSDKPAYAFTVDLTDKEFYSLDLINGAHQKLVNPYKFKWTAYVNDNFYQLTSIDEKGYAEFSTPFVDIQDLRGVSFTVREETDVYLKILATLKTKDPDASSAPIVFSAKYMLTEPGTEDNSADAPYPFSIAQLPYLDIAASSSNRTVISKSPISSGTYANNWTVSTSGDVLMDAASGNVNVSAFYSVELLPGFTATPANSSNAINMGTDGSSRIVSKNHTDISNLVTFYFGDCNSNSLKSANLGEANSFKNLIKNAEEAVFAPSLYPNPTDGIVNVVDLPNNSDEHVLFQLFDNMGNLINSDIISSPNYKFDISKQNAGLYFIKLLYKNQLKVIKVVKQ